MNKRELQDDEFDIEELLYKLFLLFKKFINWLFYPVKLVFNKPKRLTIIIGIFVVFAIIIRYATPAIYKSHFVLKPDNQTDLNFVGMLNDIETLIKDDDYEELASILQLDQSICENIFKIENTLVKTNKFYKYNDSINCIVIDIYTYDRNQFDTVQKAIYSYIENSEYYSKSRNIRIENINEMERKLNKDMSDIDSLKKSLTHNAGPRAAGGFVYGEPINPMNVYEKAIVIYKEQLSLHYQTSYTACFELVKKCMKTKKRFWPRLSILLPISFVLGGLFNLSLSFVEIRKLRKQTTN